MMMVRSLSLLKSNIRSRCGFLLPTIKVAMPYYSLRRMHQAQQDIGVEERRRRIHFLDDYLLPNYLLHPAEYDMLNSEHSKEKAMPFTDDKDGEVVDIIYGEKPLMEWLANVKTSNGLSEESLEMRLKEAALRSNCFSLKVGKEFFSWIYFNICWLYHPQDFESFINFASILGSNDFQEYLSSEGIYPRVPLAHTPMLFFHTLNMPERDASKFKLGFRITGSCYHYIVGPEHYYLLEEDDGMGEERRRRLKEFNGTSEAFKHREESDWGPVLTMSIGCNFTDQEKREAFLDFFSDMRYTTVNSLALVSNKKPSYTGEYPDWYSEMEKPVAENNWLDTDLPGHLNKEDAIPVFKAQGQGIMHEYKLQVIPRNPQSVQMALSLMKSEDREGCFVYRNNHQNPANFFFGLRPPPSSLISTLIGHEMSLASFLSIYARLEEHTLCAVELSIQDISLIMNVVNTAGFNTTENSLYVVQPSAESMIDTLTLLSKNTLTLLSKNTRNGNYTAHFATELSSSVGNGRSGEGFHLFETLPYPLPY